MKDKKTGVITEEHSFYETSYEEPEAVKEQKRVMGMEPRKTYEEAKKEFAKKNEIEGKK